MAFTVTRDELNGAEGYFGDHLQGGVWTALTLEEKSAALKTANMEIAALLGDESVDMTDTFKAAAVYEQAFFLAGRSGCSGANAGVTLASESIDGIGSRSYMIDPDAEKREFSARALRFIAPYRHRGGISRG